MVAAGVGPEIARTQFAVVDAVAVGVRFGRHLVGACQLFADGSDAVGGGGEVGLGGVRAGDGFLRSVDVVGEDAQDLVDVDCFAAFHVWDLLRVASSVKWHGFVARGGDRHLGCVSRFWSAARRPSAVIRRGMPELPRFWPSRSVRCRGA